MPTQSAGVASTSFPNARFNSPGGVAFDTAGNLFVVDTENHTIRKISETGVTTFAGTPGMTGADDGKGAAARFSYPRGITIDRSGNIYVTSAHAIRKITPDGAVTTLAGAAGQRGYANGSGSAARFNMPWGLTADAAGNLYVADSDNYVIRKVTQAGVVTTYAGTAGRKATVDGSPAAASFQNPMGVALDAGGNLYVADFFGYPSPNLIEGSTYIRKVAPDGQVSTVAGRHNPEQEPRPFDRAFGLASDPSGNVYVTNPESIHKVTPTGEVSTVAASSTTFEWLQGIARHPGGDWYVSDANAHTIWRVSPSGSITVLAGSPNHAGSQDSAQ